MKSLSIIIIISSGTEENIVSEPRIHSKKMGMSKKIGEGKIRNEHFDITSLSEFRDHCNAGEGSL